MGGGRYRQGKRVVAVGVGCVGGKILSDEWFEFNRKLRRNFSSMETDLVRPEVGVFFAPLMTHRVRIIIYESRINPR